MSRESAGLVKSFPEELKSGHNRNAGNPVIEWEPPAPRRGLKGSWDRFIGPGALAVENWLLFAAAFGLGGLAVALTFQRHPGTLSVLEILVVIVLAFDIAGGVVANATTAAKRWYHRPSQGPGRQLGFVSIHVIHIGLVAVMFAEHPWAYLGVGYVFLLTAATLIVWVPRHVQRPVAMGMLGVGVTLSLFEFAAAPGLEWLMPLLYLKLLVSHLVFEAPFGAGASLVKTLVSDVQIAGTSRCSEVVVDGVNVGQLTAGSEGCNEIPAKRSTS